MDYGDDRDPTGPHFVQNAKQSELVPDVEVRGGLIEQKNVRLLRQASGHSRELALAGREGPQAPRGELFDARSHERCSDGTVVFGGERAERAAVRVAPEGNALLYGEARRGHIFGGDEGNHPSQTVAAPFAEGAFLHSNAAARSRKKPGESAKQRGLSGRIGSDDGERLAGLDAQIDSVEYDGVAAPNRKIPSLKQGAHARPRRAKRK
jgi:hypothetical protein